MKRLLFFIMFMGLWLLAFYMGFSSTTSDEQAQKPSRRVRVIRQDNRIAMQGVDIIQQDKNRVAWELHSEDAFLNDEQDQAILKVVRFKVFPGPEEQTPGGEEAIHGKSSRAVLNTITQDLLLEGDVILFQGSHMEIRTQSLEFDQSNGFLQAPGEVWVSAQGMIHQGRNLRISLRDKSLQLDQPMLYR
ncbi:MAG: LPS export ABC transporter periplasmic protein LptC [Deltaproteobacteria bacterium]|nr:LPS export ABC transporter periplasmic protein LptC [Deltaproteobacteria bacterium]